VVQLHILSGKMAGVDWVARRFPFRVGRSPSANLRLEDDGVWDDHLTFSLAPNRTVELTPQPGAWASINGETVSTPTLELHNGDLIAIGAVTLRFGLSPARQKGLRLREGLVWLGLMLIALLEIGLIYWLIGLTDWGADSVPEQHLIVIAIWSASDVLIIGRKKL
jgi:hypothetical protein